MNIDPESSAPLRRRAVAPAGGADGNSFSRGYPAPPPGLSGNHPLQMLKRGAIVGGTLYGLHELNVFHNIIHSPHISHTWFKAGLALSILIIALKAYVELYEGKTKKRKVEYENFRTATHAVIFLLLAAWVSFHMALSPVYGGLKSFFIMVAFGYGVLVHLALLVPVWGQNVISVVLLTFFLQQYQ